MKVAKSYCCHSNDIVIKRFREGPLEMIKVADTINNDGQPKKQHTVVSSIVLIIKDTIRCTKVIPIADLRLLNERMLRLQLLGI